MQALIPFFRECIIRVLVIILFLTSSIPMVAGEMGCFYREGSPLHCQDLEETAAQEECSLLQGCFLATSFFPGKKCTDASSFPQCHKILCKGTCQQEWKGQCALGEIPPGEALWCSPGCCRFVTAENENQCSFEETMGACEMAARNADAAQFQFNSGLSEGECSSSCVNIDAGGEDGGWASKAVTPLQVLPSPFAIPEEVPSLYNVTNVATLPETAVRFNLLLWVAIVVAVAALVGGTAYYAHVRRTNKKSAASEEKSVKERSPLDVFSPFQSNPQTQEHLGALHHEIEHKRREKERGEVLTGFAILEKPLPESNVEKLQKLLRRHKPRMKSLSLLSELHAGQDSGSKTVSRPEERSESSPSRPPSALSILKSFINKKS